MSDVGDDKHVRIAVFAAHANALATAAAGNVVVVDAHIDNVVVDADETAALSGRLRDIRDVAVCRVGAGEEIHLVEEVVASIVVDEAICGKRRSDEQETD